METGGVVGYRCALAGLDGRLLSAGVDLAALRWAAGWAGSGWVGAVMTFVELL